MQHTCPKCAASFALEPMDESNLPVDYKLPPVEYDIAEAYRETPPDDFATARTVVSRPIEAPTNATPSEVLPFASATESPPVVPPTMPAPAIPQLDYTPHPTRPEPPLMMALAAGGVFGLAMILTQVPYGRIVAIPLLIVGLVLGLLALPGLHERKNIGRGAVFINVLGLIFVLFLPSWLGIDNWVPQGDPNAAPKPALSVPRDGSAPSPAQWVDAVKAVWQQDDVKVEVASVKLEPPDPKAKQGAEPPAKKVLRITLKVSNAGVARAVPLNGWPPEAVVKMTLASGAGVPMTKVETPLPLSVLPGKDATIVLQFEPPPVLTEALMLEMPAAGFGTKDAVKFSIPAAMIAK